MSLARWAIGSTRPHPITLSRDHEREPSRRAAAYSRPWRDVVRAKAILLADARRERIT
ncbi:MAG: hypothetical protein AVDCRST_MAG67-3043 [uncultured Solirubrobacteraceae bacterium]|uniref:Uncharacterized protein n=1 Tax=uncultured Solirubrobacteraceae bacterium TaxID=1162706 RepID=A0A6J4T763_9ACTN|nr:MAG: hypothetical protein AVDCRST_MAG67-3043 [uncultured Solirubrobacteraceae bacterium]